MISEPQAHPPLFRRAIRACRSVLIALGKRLFSFRTQKLSPVAAIILFKGKVARRRIIEQRVLKGLFFFCFNKNHKHSIDTSVIV